MKAKPTKIYHRFSLCLFMMLCMTACTTYSDICDSEKAGYKVAFLFADTVEKNDKWYVAGFGGSFPDEKTVKKLSLSFDIYDRETTIDEARVLLVEGIESFLLKINQDQKLRPFLANYPFDCSNLGFGIGFLKTKGGFIKSEHIAHVFLVPEKKEIAYSVLDEKTGYLDTIHSEKYEDALKIVQSQKQQSIAPQLAIPQSI